MVHLNFNDICQTSRNKSNTLLLVIGRTYLLAVRNTVLVISDVCFFLSSLFFFFFEYSFASNNVLVKWVIWRRW